MKQGQRVYWHGIFPDLNKKGTVVRTGTVRHEIRWDGAEQTTLEYCQFVKAVADHKKCKCGRCGR